MALAEYGQELDEAETAELMMAYVRRKKFEARLLAAELSALWGTAVSGSNQRTPAGNGRVPADTLLGEMGITIQ